MSFNKGYELKKFEAHWEKLRIEYAAAGMTEEAIQKMYDYDRLQFNSERTFIERTQEFTAPAYESSEEEASPLMLRYQDAITVTDTYHETKSRFAWIGEIENERLLSALENLSEDDLKLLTFYAYEGYTVTEISKVLGVSQPTISIKIKRITNFLKKFESELQIVGTCDNGEEGLELCKKLSPDLIISDIRMPKMSGLELLRKVRETNKNCFCIFVSAYTEFSYVHEAIKNGAVDYILKPIQEEELYKIIRKVIGEWKKNRNEKEKVKLLQSEVKKLKKEKQIDYKSNYDSEKYSKSVRNVLSYIEENYHQDISLESAATEVFMNKNYLSSLFCNEMGVGFTKYLSDFRLKKAKILLRETELNINEIANMTGFATANYFVRVFKKQENCTPKEYRIMEERKLK